MMKVENRNEARIRESSFPYKAGCHFLGAMCWCDLNQKEATKWA